MAYLHCSAESASSAKTTNEVRNLVLLHGKALTHEVWKSTGILAKFCSMDHVQVTAIDFDVKSDHKKLQEMLDEMRKKKLVTSLPVDVLVTPSASGKSVVTWLTSDDTVEIQTLPKYVKVWMPVASPAVRHASPKKLSSAVQAIGKEKSTSFPFKVVAIYGDQDKTGKTSAEILKKQFQDDAREIELKGGHAVYRDSAYDFVKTVAEYLAVEEKHSSISKSGEKAAVGDSNNIDKKMKKKVETSATKDRFLYLAAADISYLPGAE